MHMRLSSHHGLVLLSLLGIIIGLITGLIIVLFRLLIESIQAGMLPNNDPENYEGLSLFWRFSLPLLGGLAVGLLFHALTKPPARVGMVLVLERLSYYEGHMPRNSLFMQFIGAAICIISGQSVGRETPSVQMGCSISSLVGQSLQLPNNSIRKLVGCGAAAAIAAAFNTPLAGVVFALEVVLMEYTVAGFVPIILAAGSATVVSFTIYGREPAFQVPPLGLHSQIELPYIIILGVIIGCLAAMFIAIVQFTARRAKYYDLQFWQRTTIAGLCMGIISMAVPGIMSIGYDTVNAAFLGTAGIWLMLSIAICKVLATGIGAGMGVPAGLIGPTLVMGATAGAAFGLAAGSLPGLESNSGFYAMLGMGAMMGAALNAPLAALFALGELTLNPNIVLPGLLAIASAALVTKGLFGKESVFITLLREMGLDYHNNPITQTLRSLGVVSVMNRSFILADRYQTHSEVKKILTDNSEWIIFKKDDETINLLPTLDLANFVQINLIKNASNKHLITDSNSTNQTADENQIIDLADIPAKRLQATSIYSQATLELALKYLTDQQSEALVVKQIGTDKIYGVVTRQAIEECYSYK